MWSEYDGTTDFKSSAKIISLLKPQEKIFAKTINTLKWLLYQNQLLGMVTFSFNQREFRPSTVRIICNIIFVAIRLPLSIGAIYLIAQINGTVIEKTTDIIQLVATSVYVMTIWVWSIFNRNNYIQILLKLIEFDVKLLDRGTSIDYEENRKSIMTQMIGRYAVLTVSICLIVIFAIYNIKEHEMISEILACLTLIINSALCHQTIELTSMIRKRFVILNQHLVKLIDHFKRRNISIIENKLDRGSQDELCTLCHICALHHHLSKMIKLFNETFGVMLLLMFGVSFVAIVVSLFYCTGGLQANEIDWIRALTPLLSSWTYAVDTTYVCDVCYSTIEEVNKTGELIHKIDTEDHDIRDEIEMFSLQIANEQVEFNAAGFFHINYALLFSIIGGVTTYIIILIQLSSKLVSEK